MDEDQEIGSPDDLQNEAESPSPETEGQDFDSLDQWETPETQEPEAEETEPEPESEPEPVAAAPVDPNAAGLGNVDLPPLFTEEQYESLAEQLGMSVAQVKLQTLIQQQIAQRQVQVYSIANAHLAAVAQKAPAWFQKYGSAVSRHISAMQPQVQATPNAVIGGVMSTIMEEAMRSGDIAGTLKRHSDLMTGTVPAPKPPARPSQRPSQRTPVAGQGTGGAAPRAASRGGSGDTAWLMAVHGVSEDEARLALTHEKVSGRR